jgi:hypothetical protein
MTIRHLDASAHPAPCEPLLTESMDNSGQVFPEHFAELAFDFLLEVSTDDFDAVKGATDVYVLQRVVFEDQCDAF